MRPGAVGAGTSTHVDPEVALLEGSPLFDEEWYRLLTGARGSRHELVAHYLRTPVHRRPSPQPLLDGAWFRDAYAITTGEALAPEEDPFLVHLREPGLAVTTHPLLDTTALLAEHPEAAAHPWGPLGHLLEEQRRAPGPPAWSEHGTGVASGDLRGWVVDRLRERRRREAEVTNPVARRKAVHTAEPVDPEAAAAVAEVLVDVVLDPGADEQALRRSLASLAGQEHPAWHLWAFDHDWGLDLGALLAQSLPEGSWTLLGHPVGPVGWPEPALVGAGRGDWVAFLQSGDVWAPDRLARLLVGARQGGHRALSDVLARVQADGARHLSRHGLVDGDPSRCTAMPLARLLVSRAAYAELAAAGRLGADLPGGHAFAMVRALASAEPVQVVPAVGVTRDVTSFEAAAVVPPEHRPPLDHRRLRVWHEAVLNETLVDWPAEALRARNTDVVSVVVTEAGDWRPVVRAVEAVVASRSGAGTQVQVVVVDNASSLTSSLVLESLAERFDDVDVVRLDGSLGPSLARNLAVPAVRGATTVLLGVDVVVTDGWLEPLLDALDDSRVLGAQALVVNPNGPVQGAGLVFPVGGGLPYRFLAGHHVDDAASVHELELAAGSSACLAVRTSDLVDLRGTSPVLSGGVADADLGLRAAALRPGHFTVPPGSVVHQYAALDVSSFPGSTTSRALFAERWRGRLPQDDADAWARVGLRLVRQQSVPARGPDRTLAATQPVLVRERAVVVEGVPRLRWAIKNPAPAGPMGEKWGDTHFAESLANALREAGQDVVVDRRHAFERPSGQLDDVALVLRGLYEYHPSPENVSIAWVISHPDLVSGQEARGYDRVLAASVTWAEQQSQRWGLPVEALLQATDEHRFHPDLSEPDTGHGVLFVGNSRKQDRPVVIHAAAAGLPLAVYGSEWEGRIPHELVRATFLPNREVGAAYRSAGVVLNDHWDEMREAGFVSNRLFDAAAAGARVVTDDVAGLGDLFGRSVQVARTAEELVRLCTLPDPDEVFGSDAERRAVAERVRREHSFASRARRLVEVAVQARRERGLDR